MPSFEHTPLNWSMAFSLLLCEQWSDRHHLLEFQGTHVPLEISARPV
jgi:hypothetical protein